MAKRKKCTKCGMIKIPKSFNSSKRSLDGLLSSCKDCNKAQIKQYRRTKEGLMAVMYNRNTKSSRKRGHEQPRYTKIELREWLVNQDLFHDLYDKWVLSGFSKWSLPSIDRKNDSLGYSIDNITLMTWQENNVKAYENMRNGVLIQSSHPQKGVVGTKINTGEIIEFVSANQAQRKTGISRSSISAVCLKKKSRKSAGGYTWQFK